METKYFSKRDNERPRKRDTEKQRVIFLFLSIFLSLFFTKENHYSTFKKKSLSKSKVRVFLLSLRINL